MINLGVCIHIVYVYYVCVCRNLVRDLIYLKVVAMDFLKINCASTEKH